MSHVKTVKTVQQLTRIKVKQLLEWDDLEYGKFHMEQADAYLEYHIGTDVWGVQQIKETPDFWAWWRNQWYKRDVQFMNEVKHMDVKDRVLWYQITHDAEAIEFTPHSVVLHHSFAKDVIGKATGTNKNSVRRIQF